uniref:Core-binding (CB) domain-containing protein n=1 Tax=Cacopsylla melanoneura TaxID=428564 RepID=A0A8D8W6Z4_9HEMI
MYPRVKGHGLDHDVVSGTEHCGSVTGTIRVRISDVPGKEGGLDISAGFQPQEPEQIPFSEEISSYKPFPDSILPAERRLSGDYRPLSSLLSCTDSPQTSEVSDVCLQRSAVQLDVPPIRACYCSTSICSVDELGSFGVEREGNSDHCLSGRLLVCSSGSLMPSRAFEDCSSSSQVSGLDHKRKEIPASSVSVCGLPGDFVGHRKRADFTTNEESAVNQRPFEQVASAGNLVSVVGSSSDWDPRICGVFDSFGPPQPQTFADGQPETSAFFSSKDVPHSCGSNECAPVVEIQSSQFCSPSFSRASGVPLDGCVKLGMGSGTIGEVLSRRLDRGAEVLAHQSKRTPCSKGSDLGQPSSSSESHYNASIRQQDGSIIHSETGRSKIPFPHAGNKESLFTHVCSEHSYSSFLYPREAERAGGQSVPSVGVARMASETFHYTGGLPQMGSSSDRSVCFKEIQGSQRLRESGPPRPSSRFHGRILKDLVLPPCMGVSTPPAGPPSSSSFEQRDRSVPSCGSAMDQGVLAGRSQVQSGGSSPGGQGSSVPSSGFVLGPSPIPSRRFNFGNLEHTGWSTQITGWSEEEKRLLLAAWRPSTRASYRKPWNRWVLWSQQADVNTLSPSPQHLARFLAYLFYTENLAPASIALHKSVVSTMTDPDLSSNLASHPIVTKMLRGIAASSAARGPRAIWDVSILRDWIKSHPPSESSFFEVSRHLALLLLLGSGRRVHDLTLLRVDSSHLQRAEDAVTFWPAFGSKTDSASFRQSGWHFSGSPPESIWNVCKWFDVFLNLRIARCGSLPVTDLFISTVGRVRPASRAIIAGWVKTAFTGAGISFSVGSIRSAVNSSLARDNFSLDIILQRANWRVSDTFLRHYYRPLVQPPVLNSAHNENFHPIL